MSTRIVTENSTGRTYAVQPESDVRGMVYLRRAHITESSTFVLGYPYYARRSQFKREFTAV
jgi:hypothetical protein